MPLADEWTTDDYEYEDGQPVGMTYADVGRAISVWANCQDLGGQDVPILKAAEAFNMSEFGVRKAVGASENPFFFVNGDTLASDGL